MRIAIYSPYLDTFGGGEKYILTVAEILSSKAAVDLIFDNHLYSLGAENLTKNLGKRFDLDLSKVRICKGPVGKGSNSIERLLFFAKYDLLIYLTDGSIFYPTARKNIIHIQSPLAGEARKNLWGKFKLKGWDLIIYNSEFTKKNSESNWPIDSVVLYPPVDTDSIKPLKKKKYILSVGRFFGYLKDKKHEVMIKVYKGLQNSKKIDEWSLHLVGAASDGDESYLKKLQSLSKGFSIKFYPNLGYSDLVRLYGQSSLYWHAAGFGEDDPTRMEHFGISTVEAMAAGCVPVVINKGGQTEIVENGKTGFLWNNLEDLKEFTTRLVKDQSLRAKLSREAVTDSRKFSKKRFESEIGELIKRL